MSIKPHLKKAMLKSALSIIVICSIVIMGYFKLLSIHDAPKMPSYAKQTTTQKVFNTAPLRVSIIGAGIAGSSCSFYLKELLKSQVEITVYERENRIGGRTAKLVFKGQKVEYGGSAVILENHHAQELMKKFGLSLQRNSSLPLSRTSLVVWDPEQEVIAYQDLPWKWLSNLSTLWRYGLTVQTARDKIRSNVDKFVKVYDIQKNQEPWQSWKELMDRIGLFDQTQESFYHHMVEKAGGIRPNFLHDVLEPLIRVNYLQNSSISAFGGSVGCAGIISSFFQITEGSDALSIHSLAHSGATVRLNSTVTDIERIGNEFAVSVTVCDQNTCNQVVNRYDIVILAAPLELSDITFKNITLPSSASYYRQYRKTHVTLVVGEFQNQLFGLSTEKLYNLVSKASSEESIVSISPSISFEEDGKKKIMYKIFSMDEMQESQLDRLFKNREYVFKHVWNAYPILNPTKDENWHPIQLAENIYYINSFESVISTMETQLISSKNVAQLINKKFNQ